jgi:hypothetical protein
VASATAVLAMFNQPLVALSDRREVSPLVVDPPLAGRFRWLSGDTAKLELQSRPRYGTIYTVRIPAGTRSLGGKPLGQEVSWQFRTPPPTLRGVRLGPLPDRYHEGLVEPADTVRLDFDQPVSPAEIGRFARLTAEGVAVDFEAEPVPARETYDRPDDTAVRLRPVRPLPRGATLVMTLAPGFRGVEGPRPATRGGAATFGARQDLAATVTCDGSDMGVKDATCWPMKNDAHEGLAVSFTAPVLAEDVRARLVIQPAVREDGKPIRPADWKVSNDCRTKDTARRCTRTVRLDVGLERRTAYTVTLRPGVRDVFGRTLKEATRVAFTTRGLPPGLFVTGNPTHDEREDEWVLEHPRRVRVKTVNLRTLDLRTAVLGPDTFVPYLECLRRDGGPEDRGGPRGDDPKVQPLCLDTPPPGLRVVRRSLPATGAGDRVIERELPLVPPGRRGAVVAFAVSSPEYVDPKRRPIRLARVVSHTDLDVHARLLPYSHHVWVTSLATGQPVAGASVEVRDAAGQRLHAGRTDASGLAELPGYADLAPRGTAIPRVYVWVATAADATYALPGAGTDTWSDPGRARPSEGGRTTWQGEGPHAFGFVASERGIYRPGEAVHLYGVLRQWRRGITTPLAGGQATVEVSSPARVVIATESVTLDDFGAFTTRIELPRTARLGHYRMAVHRPGQRSVGTGSFQVELYRAPRFLTTLRTAAYEVVAGETVASHLTGQHLSGSALGGAAYRYAVERRQAWPILPGLTSYTFGGCLDHAPGSVPPGEAGRGEGQLDAAGAATIPFPTAAGRFECDARYTLETEVRDPTQASVAQRTTFLVRPADRYVGVRRLATGAAWKQTRFHVVVADPAGRRQAGHRVTLRVLPPSRPTAPRREAQHDWAHPVLAWSVIVPAAGVDLSFEYPLAHPEVVAALTVTDAAGRIARTDVTVYRPTAPRPEVRYRPAPETPEPLKITLDRRTYEPGQTAVITVTAGAAVASGMVFVERERAHGALPLRFVGRRATVRFPVTEAHIGNLSLTAVAYPAGPVRSRSGDPVRPVTASAELDVSDEALSLDVDVVPDKRQYRPGDEVTVDFTTRAKDGKPREVELVVMAVDEAVLRLTSFHLRDPYRSLYFTPEGMLLLDELREYLMGTDIRVTHVSSESEDALGALVGHTVGFGSGLGGGLGLRGGGFGMKADDKARKLFATTPLFRLVRSGADGKGRLTFKLPGDLTAFRIMAVAFDRDRRAGIGQSVIEVETPVYAAPALPRQVRVGDRFEGGVVVNNTSLPEGAAEVSIQVTGLAVTGERVKRVTVPRAGSREVRFALEARASGTARLAFRVRLGTETDALEVPLEVVVPAVPQRRAVAGSKDGSAHQAVDALAAVQPDFGGLDVSFSTTLLGGVEEGMDQLIRYPYGCMEQRSSQLLPLLAVIALGNRFGARLPGRPADLARRALSDLLAFQTPEGGFTLWPQGREASPWLTAYALLVLHRARLAGVAVPPTAVASATRYLREALTDRPGRGVDWVVEASRPLAALALALHGHDAEPLIRRALAGERTLPVFARIQLLHAIGLHVQAVASGRKLRPLDPTGRPRRATRAGKPEPHPAPPRPLGALADDLLRELANHVKLEGEYAFVVEPGWSWGWALMSSSDRTTAMLLSALLAARPGHPLVERLARYLVFGRKDAGGRPTAQFRNTQEAAFGLLGLWDYARIREATIPDLTATVWLGKQKLLARSLKGRDLAPTTHHVPMAELLRAIGQAGARLVFQKQGAGRLYYSARLTYARRSPLEPAVSRGFALQRTLTVLDAAGRPLAAGRTPRLGDVVAVVTTVQVTEPRRFVVLDDPLPAGLEAIDSRLATGSRLVTGTGLASVSRSDHRELRDDRVLHFVNVLPPGTHRFGYLARVSTPGTFVWPSARAEEMYTPEVYGVSPGTMITTR